MKITFVLLSLFFTVLASAQEAIPSYSPGDVFKNQDALKGKLIQMLNTQREHKQISDTEMRLMWSYGQVSTVTTPAQGEQIMGARTLYVIVTETGPKGAIIKAVGNALKGEGAGKTAVWE